MKTLGLLGGMSWESTLSYYRLLNEGVKARLGGFHSAKICLVSVDFAEIEAFQRNNDWERAGQALAAAGCQVEAGGAQALVIATNTMHRVANDIDEAIGIPLLHIADATGEALSNDGIRRVGLLGTRFTMEQAFYRQRLEERFGVEVVVPDEAARASIHEIIFSELVQGEINPASRARFVSIIDMLAAQGVEGVILGCTEIAMLIQQQHTAMPLYDTTALHVDAALAFALDGG